ncbi:hypothetical protein M5K25_021480 [Dendrobium thyrsiflorum]|uniref:thioredoxin-dependent peroxiredoxin n=1 Tax=Dendrobium thyrsiflorum TaxID=117978 RepID=A0ABD0UJG0_DENTH
MTAFSGYFGCSISRVAAPPYRSSPSLDGRPSIGSSFGSVSYDSPLGPTPSHLSQPLASPDLDPASVILIEKCIKKKSSPEPETECIHFMDANDIADNEDFLEDETEVIKVDSLHDLNPELGSLEPLDLDTFIHPDPNLIKDIPLDKVCMDDINLILKEADLTLDTLKLNSEDSDLIVSPTKETSNNSDLILNNSDEDNLDLKVSQMDLLPELDPDLIDLKSIELRVMTKHDSIENTNMSLEGRNLKLKDFELNWNNEHSLVLLESFLGVAPLNLHLKEFVLPDWAYHITPPTDWNENISPRFHVVPTSNLDTLPRLLSHIPAGDSLGYVIMVESDDPSSYHTPDSYILPATSSSFPIKDHLSPSWLTLLDYTTATGRLSMTLVETSYRNALFSHLAWIQTDRKAGGLGNIKYPLISDVTKSISRSYGVLIPDQGIALRGLFIIDKEGVIQHSTINNLAIGRSVDETMRTLQALQFVQENPDEVCPAGWKSMKPDPKLSKEYFAAI